MVRSCGFALAKTWKRREVGKAVASKSHRCQGTQWSWSSPAFKNDPHWRFPKMGVSPIAGWFIMEHPKKKWML